MKKIVLLFVALILVACKNDKKEVSSATKENPKTELQLQANNFFKPISSVTYEAIPEKKIELGKKLYFDTRLSKDGNISCNSCHNLNTFGVDNLPTSPGDTEEFGNRNSPTVIYASLHAKQFWDGRAKDVEEQAGMPILNPVEHNIPSEEFLVNRIKDVEEYQQLFKEVFPDEDNPITYKNLTGAIGAFERQFLPESRFDKWLEGDDFALSTNEKAGLKAFIDNGCIACHNGPAMGGQLMQKFGLYGNYWEYTKSKNIDAGLYEVTKNDGDKYIFKTPSLRNIEKTYPYFHDGSVSDLEEAIKIMAKLQSNKEPSAEEVKNIAEFLKALTADIDDKYKTL